MPGLLFFFANIPIAGYTNSSNCGYCGGGGRKKSQSSPFNPHGGPAQRLRWLALMGNLHLHLASVLSRPCATPLPDVLPVLGTVKAPCSSPETHVLALLVFSLCEI